ncbi:MFS general substrate transporter [Desarmillaria tabescens]|uniref:MFS general substrate transporter n=1 Tax=Armillaria tabescens TaxID=1929756 RepID=A0AA39KBY9_ARMTA|nr:MFS general substrate transporter [Desarmillaria tabescens]KAK0457029.1 MFS general substrate transporter [Desarmillaria tabescens]
MSKQDQDDSKNNPYYLPQLSWTDHEESKIVRTLDTRLFPWILLTTFVLNMDRTNHSNAVSDNLAADLGFTNNTVNLGIAIYSVIFSFACLSGAVISKIVGPARWIPVLMFAWGLVTMAHALITDRGGYLTVIALTEGGVIPATLVYLGSFYKGTELATRLAWFWGIQTIASAVSGLMASGLLQLRGVGGLEGWKWLFLIDGIITVVVAVATWFYLPRNITQTVGGLRGWKPWFDEKELCIGVTRVVRDDISKRVYEQKVKWSDVKDAATDLGLWGHLLITISRPVIKSFHFNVFVANALTAPPYVLQCIMMVSFIWHSDRVRERGLHGAFGAAWQLVGWILLRALPSGTSRGVKYFAAVVVAAWPYTHPLNIAWMSENTGSVGKRTLASGCVIFAANIYGGMFDETSIYTESSSAFKIYQSDDSPDYKRGNTINICFAGVALILWFIQKYYYRYRNARNATLYAELSEHEKVEENDGAEERGNRGLTFRFTT